MKKNLPSFRSLWLYPWLGFLAFLVLSVWLFIIFDLKRQHRAATEESHVETRNFARLYAEEVTSSINLIDFALKDLRDHWNGNPKQYAGLVQSRQVFLDPSIAFYVSIVDAKGNIVFSTNDVNAPEITVSDREHFRFHQNNTSDELYISAPILGRVFNRWGILFTRRLIDSSGKFKGIIAMAVSPEYFSRFHQRIEFAHGSSISIVRTDGKMLSRHPRPELALGNAVADAPFLQPDAPRSGHFWKVSEVDAVQRLYSWQVLEEFDLVMVVGESTASMYEQYRYQRTVYVWSGLGVTLVFVIIGCLIFIYYRRREIELANRAAMAKALARSQKLEAIGQMTSGIAHDFNNILQIISGNLQMLETDQENQDKTKQRLASTMDAVDHGTRLVLQLLSFSRRKPLQASVIHPGKHIEKIDSLIQRLVGDKVELAIRYPEDLWQVEVDPDLMENVVLNLASNARDAMDGSGRLSIELKNETVDTYQRATRSDMLPGDYVRMSVGDTGSGMPQEVIDHAFEPFFTTKPDGKGTGLGLSMAYGFVQQSGGYIYITSRVEQGTTFDIFLPRCRT